MTKHSLQDLILNPTYREMADHYNTVVMPARVGAPKDKSSVEGSVGTISTWIIAALRNTHCFSIEELNEEIRKKLDEFNNRPFTKKNGCRFSAFEEEEKFALSPLPSTPYKISVWKTAKVRPDYHISIESIFYSVPYEYIGKQVEIRLTEHLIEAYFNHMRIATHKRLYGKFGQFSTHPDHMPDNHRLYIEQTPENAREWAKGVGEHTESVIENFLKNSQNEKVALKAIFSLKKSERRYSKYEIERASKMILSMTKRPTVKALQTLLATNKKNDIEKEAVQRSQKNTEKYGFVRGAAYYGGRETNERTDTE